MIAIITAMESEAKSIINTYDLKKVDDTTYQGTHILLGISGIGKIQATMKLTQVLERYPDIKTIINIGVVGALDPDIKRGQVMLASEVREHDAYLPDSIRESDVYEPITLSPIQIDGLPTGVVMTGDQFIEDEAVKDKLHSLGGHVCDMECSAYARVAREYKKAFCAIKVVVDQREEGSLDYEEHLDSVTMTLSDALDSYISHI